MEFKLKWRIINKIRKKMHKNNGNKIVGVF
jgi:hypothetical protein